ncbi:hypothetical protein ACA910_017659 [Epithemia clementina (nom. ined.)]
MHWIQVDPNLEKILTLFKLVIDLFLKQEIIQYPMLHQYKELEQIPEFTQGDLGQTVWHNLLHHCIIQHNIYVVSKYYKQIRFNQLAQLLQLVASCIEQEVSSMVSDGGIFAKSILLALKQQPTCIQYAGHYACAKELVQDLHKIILPNDFSNFRDQTGAAGPSAGGSTCHSTNGGLVVLMWDHRNEK